eukprot:Seg2042.5 transcript_id=Seg2042.5/GoldUCD/mRNA.D3Y31 product=Synaptophysin protein_id=Seg2042.5/GoldUCD/D3Y31
MRQNFQFEVLKEPRGFIKVIQIFVAIFAFATCTGYNSGNLQIVQKCASNDTGRIVLSEFGYPYNKPLMFRMMVCSNGVATKSATLVSINALNYRSSMEYFVVIGVFCFLYSLGVLVYYIIFEEDQTTSSAPPSKFSPPVIDFVISVVFVIFWFTGAIACAASVTGIKNRTSLSAIIPRIPQCKGGLCSPRMEANLATLHISALIGFLNVFVWCGNLWFLYKETPWHSPKSRSAATVSGPGSQPPQVTPPAAAI